MTARNGETRAGKRNPIFSRGLTKVAANKLPKSCQGFLRNVWQTSDYNRQEGRISRHTTKKKGTHQDALSGFQIAHF
jgi:hypothetical protein